MRLSVFPILPAPPHPTPTQHASAHRSYCKSRAGSSWSSCGHSGALRPCSLCTVASEPASRASASASCPGCRLVCVDSRPGERTLEPRTKVGA